MTSTELRATLNANGYAEAEIRGNLIIIAPEEDTPLFYAEHRRALRAAGIPILWGGWDEVRLVYWFDVRSELERREQERDGDSR